MLEKGLRGFSSGQDAPIENLPGYGDDFRSDTMFLTLTTFLGPIVCRFSSYFFAKANVFICYEEGDSVGFAGTVLGEDCAEL